MSIHTKIQKKAREQKLDKIIQFTLDEIATGKLQFDIITSLQTTFNLSRPQSTQYLQEAYNYLKTEKERYEKDQRLEMFYSLMSDLQEAYSQYAKTAGDLKLKWFNMIQTTKLNLQKHFPEEIKETEQSINISFTKVKKDE